MRMCDIHCFIGACALQKYHPMLFVYSCIYLELSCGFGMNDDGGVGGFDEGLHYDIYEYVRSMLKQRNMSDWSLQKYKYYHLVCIHI